MVPRRARCLIIAALAPLLAPRALAVEQTPEIAAHAAAHPFFDRNQLQVQPAYTDIHDGGNSTQLLVRLALVYPALWIPGLKVGNIYSFARLEMYAESLNTPTSPNVVGLQDWNALVLGVKPFAWGAQIALGAYAVLPTATDPALDAQEFQLGPALGAVVTHVRHLQFGALVEFSFSVAGTTPGLATAQVQPVIVYQLPKAFFFKTDPMMKFDLNSSPHATVPANLHLGHAFTSHLVLQAIVQGVTTGSGVGNVTGQLNINYLGW
jgi:hypothetical protein